MNAIPAERIRLRMEGTPQENAEAAALLISSALNFCHQPGTFPAFAEFAQAKQADGPYAEVMAKLHPALLTEVNLLICAGMAADMEEASRS